jgi:hypothetical protein
LISGVSRVHKQYSIDAAKDYTWVNAEAGDERLNRSVHRSLGHQVITFLAGFE